jgi:signal transduction histidine kinase
MKHISSSAAPTLHPALPHQESSSLSPGEGMRAVIVEDDDISRRLLARVLCSEGFEVLAFGSGEDCIDAMAQYKPEVMVLDVMMPRVDGYTLCRQIKAHPGLCDVPILFLTALAQPDEKVLGFQAGAADFISKPFDRRELLARVKVHAELFSARRQIQAYAASLEDLVDQRMRMLIHADRLVTLGTMSAKTLHDLQNCLTYAFASIDLAETIVGRLRPDSSELSDQQRSLWEMLREALVDARSGVDRVDQTASGLRRYSRHVKGDKRAPLELTEVIDKAVQIIGPRARTVLDVSNHVPRGIQITGDRRLVEQVFVNLLANAADAIGECKGRVEISAEFDHRDVVIECKDNGPGIPPALQSQIFQPFFTTKEEEKGTGLGLAIVQEIVTAHQGSIRLMSSGPEGTCFEIRLPRSQSGGQ